MRIWRATIVRHCSPHSIAVAAGPLMMRHLFRRFFASAVLLAVVHVSFAQTPSTVLLQNLTWTELRDQIRAAKTTVIIPIGGHRTKRAFRSGGQAQCAGGISVPENRGKNWAMR